MISGFVACICDNSVRYVAISSSYATAIVIVPPFAMNDSWNTSANPCPY